MDVPPQAKSGENSVHFYFAGSIFFDEVQVHRVGTKAAALHANYS